MRNKPCWCIIASSILAMASKCLIKKPHDDIRLIVYLTMRTISINVNGVYTKVAYTVEHGFNYVYVNLYVKHRIAQCVNAKCSCATAIRITRNTDYSVVQLQIPTNNYSSLWYVLDDIFCKLEVFTFVDMDHYRSIKITEELLRLL